MAYGTDLRLGMDGLNEVVEENAPEVTFAQHTAYAILRYIKEMEGALASQPQWSRELPTVPGWYWWTHPHLLPTPAIMGIVHVMLDASGGHLILVSVDDGNGPNDPPPLEHYRGDERLWRGPLKQPPEPEMIPGTLETPPMILTPEPFKDNRMYQEGDVIELPAGEIAVVIKRSE